MALQIVARKAKVANELFQGNHGEPGTTQVKVPQTGVKIWGLLVARRVGGGGRRYFESITWVSEKRFVFVVTLRGAILPDSAAAQRQVR